MEESSKLCASKAIDIFSDKISRIVPPRQDKALLEHSQSEAIHGIKMPRQGISKPRKNPRRKKGNARKGSSSVGESKLLFESLSDIAVESIIRFISEKPEAAGWTAHVPKKTVDALSTAGGALARAAANLFRLRFDELPESATKNVLRFIGDTRSGVSYLSGENVLCLLQCHGALSRVARKMFPVVDYRLRPMYAPDLGPSVVTVTSERTMHSLMAEIGPHVETLWVRAPISGTFQSRVVKRCTRLRRLSFQPYIRSCPDLPTKSIRNMLARWGPGLEYIFLKNVYIPDVHLIGEYCTNLRHLKLLLTNVCTLDFSSVWNSPGENLEDFEIRTCVQCSKIILGNNIFTECPNISRLSFITKARVHDIAEACKSYGPKLLELRLSMSVLDPVVLPGVIEACPNVKIDLLNGVMSTSWVVGLGRLASSWQVAVSDEDFDETSFARVGRSCPNLQTIKVTSTAESESVKNFKDFFSAPKPHLKSLDLLLTKISSASVVFEVLIEKGCMLEELTYEGPCPPLDSLQRLMRSQNQLKKITFSGGKQCICRGNPGNNDMQQLQPNSGNIGMFWIPIMNSLFMSPSLEDIRCYCSRSSTLQNEELKQICEKFRREKSHVSIEVCRHRFL